MTFNSLYQNYIVPGSTLLPIAAGLIGYRKLSEPLKAILLYLCFVLPINICGIVLASHRINNLPLLHFYTMFEFVAVMWYYKLAFKTKLSDKWTTALMIIFPVLCVVNFTFFQPLTTFNTYTRPPEAFIIIIFSGIYLATQSNYDKKEQLNNSGRWVASGFLIYFVSSLFEFIFANIVSQIPDRQIKHLIWNIHAGFVIVMYICFFLAIQHDRRKR